MLHTRPIKSHIRPTGKTTEPDESSSEDNVPLSNLRTPRKTTPKKQPSRRTPKKQRVDTEEHETSEEEDDDEQRKRFNARKKQMEELEKETGYVWCNLTMKFILNTSVVFHNYTVVVFSGETLSLMMIQKIKGHPLLSKNQHHQHWMSRLLSWALTWKPSSR